MYGILVDISIMVSSTHPKPWVRALNLYTYLQVCGIPAVRCLRMVWSGLSKFLWQGRMIEGSLVLSSMESVGEWNGAIRGRLDG